MHDLADAPQKAHRLFGEEPDRLGAADHRKSPRLVEAGGDLGQELVVAEPGRDRDADAIVDAQREIGQRAGGRAAVQPFGTRKIEKRLVDRDRLDQGSRFQHDGAHLAADAAVFLHVGANHDGVGTGGERLVHGHRRMNAETPGDIAARHRDAAFAAADDDRLVGERGIVALLDRGVERIAIEVRDGQPLELVVDDQADRAARGAAGDAGRVRAGQAIAAQHGHDRTMRRGRWRVNRRRCRVGRGFDGHPASVGIIICGGERAVGPVR